MFKMLLLLLFVAVFDASMGGPFGREMEQPDCTERPNGVIWTGGCGSFGVCQNGQFRQVDCANGTVVNTRDMQCVPPDDALFPCNLPPMDCSEQQDHPGYRLPLMQPDPDTGRPVCSVYFTCTYGAFLPFQWCPEGTVYDEANQRCSDPVIVPPPCGLRSENSEEKQSQNQNQNQNGGNSAPRPNQQTQYNQNRYNPNRYGNSPFGQNSNTPNQDETSSYDQYANQQVPKSGNRFGQDLYGHGHRQGQGQQNQNGYGGSKQNRNPYTSGQGGNRGW